MADGGVDKLDGCRKEIIDIELRPPRPEDEQAWRLLWRGYCDFYEQDVPDEVTAATWRRLLGDDSFHCVLASRGEDVVGFANVIIHPITWSIAPVCYLEDLFVTPEARGHGIAHALIEHLIEQASSAGWSRLYWMTREDNATARRLYDRFTGADGFVRYVLHIDGKP